MSAPTPAPQPDEAEVERLVAVADQVWLSMPGRTSADRVAAIVRAVLAAHVPRECAALARVLALCERMENSGDAVSLLVARSIRGAATGQAPARVTDAALLSLARDVLRRHGHGVGATCSRACDYGGRIPDGVLDAEHRAATGEAS